jgi:hypothetical protein
LLADLVMTGPTLEQIETGETPRSSARADRGLGGRHGGAHRTSVQIDGVRGRFVHRLTQAGSRRDDQVTMNRVAALLTASILGALVLTSGATAGRSDRDPGVRQAAVKVCPPSTKPSENGNSGQGGGNSGQGGGNSGQGGGNGGSGTQGPADDTAAAPHSTGNSGSAHGNSGNNGNGNGNGAPSGNPNAGSGNNNAGGNGNRGNNGNGGNGNGGNGNGQDNGQGATDGCVSPPAEPAAGAVAGDGVLPPAKAGTSVNVEPVEGTVRVKEPGADSFKLLDASVHVPEGTVLDTRDGTIELTSEGPKATQQTAAFTGAKVQVRQRKSKSAVTELILRGGDFDGCSRLDHTRRAQGIRDGFISARKKKRSKRRGLWGNGRGRFRTRGRWGSATVRGTIWQVEDTCAGTRTTVARGVVKVRDYGLQRTVTVRAAEEYFARVRR